MSLEVVTIVDYGVFERPVAAWLFTGSSSLMLVLLCCTANLKVPHVLLLALHTDLQICVAMKLRHVFRFEPTLAM